MMLDLEVVCIARKNKDAEFICQYELKDHKIMTMEAEKRERLIMAALKEFSKGYGFANTDGIVNEAGISKGLLFHYFGSKKGLFFFLLKYCSEIITTEYEKVIVNTRDFLENVRTVSRLAVDLTFQYPLIYGFLAKAYFSIHQVFPDGLPEGMPSSNEKLLEQILENSDRSLFKEDIDVEKAQNIMLWTMKGFSESLAKYGSDLDTYKDHYDGLNKEMDEYVALLHKLFYK